MLTLAAGHHGQLGHLHQSPCHWLSWSLITLDVLVNPIVLATMVAPPPANPAPWSMVTSIALVLAHSGHLDHHSHLSHSGPPDLGHAGPWSMVTRVALTLGHHRCLRHAGPLILLPWPLVNGDHAGRGPWSPWTSQPPWLSQQPQTPGHLNHPCPQPPQFEGHPSIQPHSQ